MSETYTSGRSGCGLSLTPDRGSGIGLRMPSSTARLVAFEETLLKLATIVETEPFELVEAMVDRGLLSEEEAGEINAFLIGVD